jgi:hypothetical protein
MMKATVASLSILIGALSACGEGFSPPPGLPFAAATYVCWSSTGIELAPQPISQGESPAYPYVRVTIPVLPSNLRPGTWRSPSDNATAAYVTGPNQYEVGSGRIEIGRLGPRLIAQDTAAPQLAAAETVDGTVDLQFPSRNVTGSFRARWIARPVTCV